MTIQKIVESLGLNSDGSKPSSLAGSTLLQKVTAVDTTVQAQATAIATIPPVISSLRFFKFNTYDQNTWSMGNWPDYFGGINPSVWTDGNGLASGMSSSAGAMQMIFTERRDVKANANLLSEVWMSYSSTNGLFAMALARIKNSTGAAINWTPYVWMTAYTPWGEMASIALNGALAYSNGNSSGVGGFQANTTMSIPANRTSTIIFVSGSAAVGGGGTRSCMLGFYNNSLILPSGLSFVDDLYTLDPSYNIFTG